MPKGIPLNGINKGWFTSEKKGHLGYKHSEESKEIMRMKKLGRKLSEETKDKMSQSAKGKNSGERNGNWKGGISKKAHYSSEWTGRFRWTIRKRDNYTCQNCGKKQEQEIKVFPVHHIDFNKQNCTFKNLITLCNSCHGKTTSTKKMEYWIAYYKEKVQRL